MKYTYKELLPYFTEVFKDKRYTKEGCKKISDIVGIKKSVIAELFLDWYFSETNYYYTIKQVNEDTNVSIHTIFNYLKSHKVAKKTCWDISKRGNAFVTGACLKLDTYFKEHKYNYSNVDAKDFANTTKQYVFIYMKSRGIPTFYEVRKLDKFFSERHQFSDLAALAKRLDISESAIKYYIEMRNIKLHRYKKGYYEVKPVQKVCK